MTDALIVTSPGVVCFIFHIEEFMALFIEQELFFAVAFERVVFNDGLFHFELLSLVVMSPQGYEISSAVSSLHYVAVFGAQLVDPFLDELLIFFFLHFL